MITVYWACLEDQWMLANEPESVSKNFYDRYNFDKNETSSAINYCPSFNLNLKNVFTLQSIYDYDFEIKGNDVITDKMDQHFFNDHIHIRSIRNKFFSFRNKYIFFTDKPSLPVTFYEFPFLEDNNITQRCIIPAGIYDIGKWFRNSEFSFFLKKEFNQFIVAKGEIYSYIRIHTKEKIQFKQFRYNQKLAEYNNDGFQLTRSPLKTLDNYYKAFKNKKLILREIQDNLV